MSWVSVVASATPYAIRDDSILFSAGINDFGQRGVGYSTSAATNLFTQVGNRSWTQIASGQQFALGVSNSTLYTWGLNNFGQLGLNTTLTINTPTELLSNPLNISAGASAAAIIKNSTAPRQLFMTGVGGFGITGNAKLSNNLSPVIVSTIRPSFSKILVASGHSVGILTNNRLLASGSGGQGQLGNLSTLNAFAPIQTSLQQSFVNVTTGAGYTYGVDTDGYLWAWGITSNGRIPLGISSASTRISPVIIGTGFDKEEMLSYSSFSGVPITYWKQIAPGYTPTGPAFGISNDDKLYVWGQGTSWQSGLGIETANLSVPVALDGNSWNQVTTGQGRVFAIRGDGALFSWGSNTDGQLGLNDTVIRSSPVQIGASSWTKVAAGQNHVMAIRLHYLLPRHTDHPVRNMCLGLVPVDRAA
jgi:alpha-tubulin suppressor-like RCC1 family protein